jgi:hypothetical protein
VPEMLPMRFDRWNVFILSRYVLKTAMPIDPPSWRERLNSAEPCAMSLP